LPSPPGGWEATRGAVRRRSGRDRHSAAPPPHDKIYSSHSVNQMTEDQLDGVPRDRGRTYSDKDSCFQLPRLLTLAAAVRTRTASLSRASCIKKKTARPKLQTLHPSPSHNILKPESSYGQGPGQRAPPPAPPPSGASPRHGGSIDRSLSSPITALRHRRRGRCRRRASFTTIARNNLDRRWGDSDRPTTMARPLPRMNPKEEKG
jgi:hypothetical protein